MYGYVRVIVGRVGGDDGSQVAMTGDRERFGEKIGDVVETADDEDTKVSLADPIPDPMQTHVRCFRHPLGDRVGRNADSHLVVTKQRGGGLGVTHVGQDIAIL